MNTRSVIEIGSEFSRLEDIYTNLLNLKTPPKGPDLKELLRDYNVLKKYSKYLGEQNSKIVNGRVGEITTLLEAIK